MSNNITVENMRVCVGGTFNKFHKGHKVILKKAFDYAGINGMVYIGISTGDLTKFKKKKVKSYEERKRVIENYLSDEKKLQRTIFVRINSKYGLTLEENYDAIVISPETKRAAEEINHLRKQKGLKPMKIILVPYILAEDGKPISSTRIIYKEID
jgi:pantetheine-phosphate adenylyltransferase